MLKKIWSLTKMGAVWSYFSPEEVTDVAEIVEDVAEIVDNAARVTESVANMAGHSEVAAVARIVRQRAEDVERVAEALIG